MNTIKEIKPDRVELAKAALAKESKWFLRAQCYEFALEGENREAHLRAANERMKAARAQFRRLIK
ncbi:MAG: hypothetical protein CV087_07525 [Candidatus Brocadia sp. WS118]|nr:MAG: hypothetical protein CV087_07525 [Candidatus Brocadia sp. WS118]